MLNRGRLIRVRSRDNHHQLSGRLLLLELCVALRPTEVRELGHRYLKDVRLAAERPVSEYWMHKLTNSY